MNRLIKFTFLTTLLTFSSFVYGELEPRPKEASQLQRAIAIDGINGTAHKTIIAEMERANYQIRQVKKPVTKEQLAGVNLLLLCAPVRNELSSSPDDAKNPYLYSDEEALIIRDYVLAGGTLVCGGIGWPWVYEAYGNKKIESHPINQLGLLLGFRLKENGGKPAEKIDRFILNNMDPLYKENPHYSEIEIDKPKQKTLISSNDRSTIAGTAQREKGNIYIFGCQAILINNPLIISAIAELHADNQNNKANEFAKTDADMDEPIQDVEKNKNTQPTPNISNRPSLVTLSEQLPGIVQWISAPLREKTPDELHENLIQLRELVLDEAYSLPDNRRSAHAVGSNLCELLIKALNERYKSQVAANLVVVRRTADAKLNNATLDARRNHLMSWPQYAREVEQRKVLLEYRKDAKMAAESENEDKWAKSALTLKEQILKDYQALRQRMREELAKGDVVK